MRFVLAIRSVAGGAALALLTLSALAPAALARQARERVLYVSVFDADRKPVTGLGPDAFIVTEDGTRREILRVSPATSPLDVALVVDNSQAATPTISDLRRGLTAFVNDTAGLGDMLVVTIADRPTIVAGYSSDRKLLLNAVNKIFALPSSGATLLDAIPDVAKGMSRRTGDRAAIVAVTTENVEFSTLHYRQVLDQLRDSGAQLHAVVLRNPSASQLEDAARNRAMVLDRGPRDSGGVRIDVMTSIAYETVLRELAAILKSQYRVVYARPESLLRPERVEVEMAKPGLKAAGAPARGQAER